MERVVRIPHISAAIFFFSSIGHACKSKSPVGRRRKKNYLLLLSVPLFFRYEKKRGGRKDFHSLGRKQVAKWFLFLLPLPLPLSSHHIKSLSLCNISLQMYLLLYTVFVNGFWHENGARPEKIETQRDKNHFFLSWKNMFFPLPHFLSKWFSFYCRKSITTKDVKKNFEVE